MFKHGGPTYVMFLLVLFYVLCYLCNQANCF